MDGRIARADRSGRPERVGAEALRRLRWRARRGLLENDLLIERFLDQQGQALSPSEADALMRLLELSEAELFDLLLGWREPAGALDDPAVRQVLLRLRAVRLEPQIPHTPPRPPGA
jgi:antitoxin CptB